MELREILIRQRVARNCSISEVIPGPQTSTANNQSDSNSFKWLFRQKLLKLTYTDKNKK